MKQLKRDLHLVSLELRQVILMLGEKFVGHLADLSQGQDGGRQRVMADGAIDHGRVTCDSGSDGHLFDATGKLGQQGALGRQRTDMQRVEASLIHIDRDFDTGAFGQVGDEMRIADIAVELERLTALQGVDNMGGIFLTPLLVALLMSQPTNCSRFSPPPAFV